MALLITKPNVSAGCNFCIGRDEASRNYAYVVDVFGEVDGRQLQVDPFSQQQIPFPFRCQGSDERGEGLQNPKSQSETNVNEELCSV